MGRYLAPCLLWALFSCIYLVFAGSVSGSEIIAGTLAGAVCLGFSLRLREHFRRPLRLKPRWLGQLWRIGPALFQETWLLCLALIRRMRGKECGGIFIDHRYDYDVNDPHAGARFAFMAFGVCITPNSYLVDYDPHRRKALVRQLVGKKISPVDRAFLEIP